MKKILLVATFFAITTGIAQADEANSGVYFGTKVGADIQKVKIDSSSNMDKAVGLVDLNVGYNFKYVYNIPIRVELSYLLQDTNYKLGSYTDTEYSDIVDTRREMSMSDLMINSYLDIYTNSPFTPYITVGTGLVSIGSSSKTSPRTSLVLNGTAESFNAKKIGFNAGIGMNYAFNKNWSADLSAKYLYVGKVEFDSENTIEKIDSTQVAFGLRYSF